MKIGYSDKTCSPKQKANSKQTVDNDNKKTKSSRFLVTINVLGSAGPIRFVVNGEDNAGGVIRTALKLYAKEGRLPILGSDVNSFFLHPANAGFDVKSSDKIGSHGVRNFVLCKKQGKLGARSQSIDGKASWWRAWLLKSFTLKNIKPH